MVLVDQEIARLRAIDNEREKAHKNKMKGTLECTMPCNHAYLFLPSTPGFLNKAEKKGEPIFKDSEPVAIKSGFIEEVDSE